MQVFGIDALVRIVSHFAFIYLAFWALRSLRIENLFKSFKETQVRLTLMMLAIALGYTCSNFFLEIILLCKNIFLTFS
ncbi:DUF1146 family protein [Enterococcus devriesei]|uniref:DUF1146 family protein n=1 Tax=Enterococcus TaxID=1350 RepID=UPI0009001FC8|nr:DUF1146 family protein [Enterococcus devriesei]MBU5364930.1 DUF1146 family protein [Enterococcus devriesei]MDT2821355.1 DUF1146 family protein [Enterococcus devriesei]MDU6522856.1 DUF1146 family protein [Enterococcus sp.]